MQVIEAAAGHRAEVLIGGKTWDAPADSGKEADLLNPWGVAVDAAGNVFVADTENDRVLKRSADGTITTLADQVHRPWTLAIGPWVHAYGDLWRVTPDGESRC